MDSKSSSKGKRKLASKPKSKTRGKNTRKKNGKSCKVEKSKNSQGSSISENAEQVAEEMSYYGDLSPVNPEKNLTHFMLDEYIIKTVNELKEEFRKELRSYAKFLMEEMRKNRV